MWRKHGDPLAGAKTPEPQGEACSVDGCESRPVSRQMCVYHYGQWGRGQGDPDTIVFREPVQVCPECNAPIVDKPRHTLYCSARCSDRAWRKSTNGLAHQHRRRNALAGVETRLVTERDIARLSDRQDGACCYCGEVRKLTVEHIIPIKREGRHAIGNLALACGPCNSSKSSRLLSEWNLWKSKRVELASAA
jgi:5-methylcytosine-specific restriction endonuclease McrA